MDHAITDHKALTLTFRIGEKLIYEKSKYLKELKKKQQRIILADKDWDNIALEVEENLINWTDTGLDWEKFELK